MIRQILVSVLPYMIFLNTKFDNNRLSTFGDYLSNKNRRRQTDGQTDGNGRPISLYCRGHERSKKRIRRESADGLRSESKNHLASFGSSCKKSYVGNINAFPGHFDTYGKITVK